MNSSWYQSLTLLGLGTAITLMGALIRMLYALDKRTTLLEIAQQAEDKVLAMMASKQDETIRAMDYQKGADAERNRRVGL